MEDLYLYLLLALSALSIFNKYVVPKLRNLPPTPFSALTIIGYYCLFKQPIHRTLSQIAARHGPILLLRLGCRRVLLISSSSAAEKLFSKNDAVFANRPQLLAGKHFGCNYTNLVWSPHGGLWHHLRHVCCLEILPFLRRPEQHDSLADEVKLLIGRLLRKEEETVELKSMFMDLVFNAMMTMFVGKRCYDKKMTADDGGNEASWLREYVTDSFKMTTTETDISDFMPQVKWLGVKGLEPKMKALQKKGDSLIDGFIKEFRTRIAGFSDDQQEKVVVQFLLARQKEDPKLYTDEIIRGLVLVLMSAGTDSTAGVLVWAFSLLLNNPHVLKKAQNEIDEHVGKNRFMDHSDMDHLPYLNCIIKETMRLHPVAPLLVPHESKKECAIGGYRVPKGTMLMVNVWAIQNDPKTWDEPERFKPERFETLIGERDGFKLMPFGYGRRSCPGKHMAMRVIGLTLGSLIQCFDWERASEKMVDMTELTGLALLKAHPLMARCRPRLATVNLLSDI